VLTAVAAGAAAAAEVAQERDGRDARKEPVDAAELDQLAIAWQAGDRAAFTRIVGDLQGELRLHVAAFCDSREQVEEILQETFVTCFHKIGLYQPRGTFLAWLKAIARNHLVDHWRERQRCARLDEDVAERLVADSGLAGLEAEEEEQSLQLSRRLSRCLERLPPRARTLVERRHLDNRSLAEMARQFKQSMASLSVALHRIRQSLRRCLETSP
jgi:RNA polymerase sigma factor (sigma-70 family)